MVGRGFDASAELRTHLAQRNQKDAPKAIRPDPRPAFQRRTPTIVGTSPGKSDARTTTARAHATPEAVARLIFDAHHISPTPRRHFFVSVLGGFFIRLKYYIQHSNRLSPAIEQAIAIGTLLLLLLALLLDSPLFCSLLNHYSRANISPFINPFRILQIHIDTTMAAPIAKYFSPRRIVNINSGVQ